MTVPDVSPRYLDEVDPAARPPRWLPKAFVMAVVATIVGVLAWRAMGMLTALFTNLVIALFISLMLEPMIAWLVRHRWKRGAATGVVMGGAFLAIVAMIAMFGTMFVTQVIELGKSVPETYENIRTWASESFGAELPEKEKLLGQAIDGWGDDIASSALGIGSSLLGFIFAVMTIGLVVYYLCAAGPKFRVAICSWLAPKNQVTVLHLWEVTQVKVSGFINSRLVLAFLSTAFTLVFLIVLDIPYSLPLALFTGIVSQFVPTIGTYIGGALPILLALAQSPMKALAVLVFIVVYQQIENYIFSPKISQKALEMNPAVAFVVVLAFGAVFGALGAFLALPVAATIQAVASTYLRRHELVDSALLREHEPADGWKGTADPDDTGVVRIPAVEEPDDGAPADAAPEDGRA
ncbi:AI-2E family transporter [Sanguibacter sp. HDW7]|uniref:AI-2E family transporter n=1 Tax=Sanguibacter sp. HDW7 TaxID=2714931 RepID=UPI001F0E9C23|nr:AI-2E family transporter [Sanguibacter sp. HDW7]